MIPYVARAGRLHYSVYALDGTERSTSCQDTPVNREYLEFAHRAPLEHQVDAWARFRDEPFFALFWEQRVRKTKTALDVFRYLYDRHRVDSLIVVAYPNGVHRTWAEEVAKDFPSEALVRTKVLAWASGRSNKRDKHEWLAARGHLGPVVATFNCEAIIGKLSPAWKWLDWFLARRRAMIVADESSWAANWSARTQRLIALRRRGVVRAILDGTPVEEGPGELYFPTSFLKKGILGFDNVEAFRARYFEYEEEEVEELEPVTDENGEIVYDPITELPEMRRTGRVIVQRKKGKQHNPANGEVVREFDLFKGYRHVEELEAKLKRFGSRILRSDVSDAPAKTFQSRYFDLTPAQRTVYDDLRARYVAELAGVTVRATNVLLRMTRLQMVARNYYPPEDVGVVCPSCGGADDDCEKCGGIGIVVETTGLRRIDPTRNPATEALVEEVRTSRASSIVVWCAFRQDVLDVEAALRSVGRRVARYDGGLSASVREANYDAFRRGEVDDLVATIQSGLQRGHDLSSADLVAYYSNVFSLRSRRQSEDRTESLDRRTSTSVVDLIASDTRDLTAIAALREKRSIALAIMGDPVTEWI